MIDWAKRQAAAAKAWADERKAQPKPIDPPSVTIPDWLVKGAQFASWVAMIGVLYFLWLYTLDIARDHAAPLEVTRAGTWTGQLEFYFPYIVGYAILAFLIAYVAKIAIPIFMSLDWRTAFWPKLWALFIAFAVSLVVISGSFAVQGRTLMERDRDSTVAVEQVQQGRAALEAQIEGKRQELADMMNNRNAYLAQAASVGAVEWERSYIAQARTTNDPRLPMLERALGAARSADNLRAEISALRQQLATSPTVASVQGEVVTERTDWIAATLGWLEGVRAIIFSLVMDIVALIMPSIALRLEQKRNRQLGLVNSPETSGWAPEGLRIPDLRAQAKPEPQPMEPYKEQVFDAETGEELVHRKATWAKKPKKKGKAERVEINPEIPPDEKGIDADGGGRIAVGADGTDGVMIEEPPPPPAEPAPEAAPEVVPDLTDAEMEALAAELEAEPPVDPVDTPQNETDGEKPEEKRQAETNPARMIEAA